MLTELFKTIAVTSFAGTALTCLLVLAKPVTKKLFGYLWHYYIWLTVLAVMLLPVRFDLPRNETIHVPTPTVAKVLQIPEIPATQSAVQDNTGFTKQIASNQSYLGWIWLAGAVIMLLIYIIGYVRLLMTLRRNSVPISCPEIQAYTSKTIQVRVCENLVSPFILGILRPTLILPKRNLSPSQLNNILRHEMTHFRRKDLLYKYLTAFVKCVHWFNPVVYYVAREIYIECEISCDLSVVSHMSTDEVNSYIGTILSLLSGKNTKNISLTTGMTGSKKMLKRRFKMIKNKKKTSRVVSVISMIIAVFMLSATVLASGILKDRVLETKAKQKTTPQENNINTNNPLADDTENIDDDATGYITGKLGILTDTVQLRNEYIITLDKEGNYIPVKLENSNDFMHKNDMVIVLAQNDTSSRVMQISNDIPSLCGTIDNAFISYDANTFATSSNQAIADNIMGYNDINGNEMGIQNSRGLVVKRTAEWVLLSLAGGGDYMWFPSDELSYNFDVNVIDAINMPID